MKLNIRKVGVIGAGQMGNGIAHVCALSGFSVLLNDVAPERVKSGLATINGNMARQVSKQLISEDEAREIGAIRTPSFPPLFDEWAREFRRFRPVDAARRLAPRPLLVMHGDDDESVPTVDARQQARNVHRRSLSHPADRDDVGALHSRCR